MVTISLVSTFRRQFLQAIVDKSPKKHVYFFKSASKSKIGTFQSRELQMCMELELWARSKPSKRKIQIWLFRDFTVDKPGFFASSPQGFTATRCSEINVFGHILLVFIFLNQVLFEFLKKKMF
jgi:hypothetical protein